MSTVARILLGPWRFVAFGAAFSLLIVAFWAPVALAGKIRDRREDREWAAEVAERVRAAEDFREWEREIYGRETAP